MSKRFILPPVSGSRRFCPSSCQLSPLTYRMITNVSVVDWCTISLQLMTLRLNNKCNGLIWSKFMPSITARFCIKADCFSLMDSLASTVDTQMGDAEILEAFKAMGPLLTDRFIRDTQEENDSKRHKRNQPQGDQAQQAGVTTMLRLMGSMILRLGSRSTVDEKARLFHLLSANRASCPTPSPAGEGQSLASGHGPAEEDPDGPGSIHSAAGEALPGHGGHAARQSDQAVEGGSNGLPLDDGLGARSHHGDGQLPLSEVEQSAEGSDPYPQGTRAHDTHAEVHRSDAGGGERSHGSGEISFSSPRRAADHSAMDHASWHAPRRDATDVGIPEWLNGLGIIGSLDETTFTGSEQAEPTTPGPPGQGQEENNWEAGPGQRQGEESNLTPSAMDTLADRLRAGLEHISLANVDNWCFINSTVLSLIWAVLSCDDFEPSRLGSLGHDIVQFFLMRLQNPSICVMLAGFMLLQVIGQVTQNKVTQWNF